MNTKEKNERIPTADIFIADKEEALSVIAHCPLFMHEIKDVDIEKLRCCSVEFLCDLASRLVDFGALLLEFRLNNLK